MLKIGHRGYAAVAPENSEASFKEALKRKVDMIEFDVRLTKDDKLVIFHDSTLERICGEKERVIDLTLKDLKKYDIGSWYSPEYFQERVMTLQELINLVGTKADYNIEVKIEGSERDSAVIKLINLIEKEGIIDKVVVTSFDFKFLKHLKEAQSSIKTGIILEEDIEEWEKIIEYTGADGMSINYEIISEEVVAEAKKKGYFVYVWTVNNKYAVNGLRKMKVDGIISDDPSILK